jgi:hypothetical protein
VLDRFKGGVEAGPLVGHLGPQRRPAPLDPQLDPAAAVHDGVVDELGDQQVEVRAPVFGEVLGHRADGGSCQTGRVEAPWQREGNHAPPSMGRFTLSTSQGPRDRLIPDSAASLALARHGA